MNGSGGGAFRLVAGYVPTKFRRPGFCRVDNIRRNTRGDEQLHKLPGLDGLY